MAELPSSLQNIELLVLDMDGVITSESAYWDTAGLVVRDLLDSPAYLGLCPPDYTPITDIFYRRLNRGSRYDWRKYLPADLIKRCKSRGINSNWDLAYLVAGLYIAPLLSPFSLIHKSLLGEDSGLLSSENEENTDQTGSNFSHRIKENLSPVWERLHQHVANGTWKQFLSLRDFHLWGSWFRERECAVAPVNKIELLIMDDFHPDMRGVRLLDEINKLIDTQPSDCYPLFGRNTILWKECRDLFQQWYLGEDIYREMYGSSIPYSPKPGLIHNEEPLHGLEKTRSALSRLRQAGYKLGIATGRPRMEIMTPLREWDILQYFDEDRIVTHDDVEDAEKELHDSGIQETVSKPHPYAFMKSIHPEWNALEIYKSCDSTLPQRGKVLIVGDAMADIWAAKKIDCPCAAVLSGAAGESGRRDFESAHPDLICHDFLEVTELLLKIGTK